MRQTIQELVERYQNSLYAVAFNVCKNQQDAEDAVQDTFLQYYNSKKEFESEQHIRAWLIRVAINKAKNMNLSFWRKNKISLEDYMETLVFETPESEHLFETVMRLPEKYRIVIDPENIMVKLINKRTGTVKAYWKDNPFQEVCADITACI